MPTKSKKPGPDRMIHVRLDEKTHRSLKIYAAKSDSSIQQVVSDLIQKQIGMLQDKSVQK